MKLDLPPAPYGLPHPVVIIATWFGVGLLPKAPGTWGSLGALPLAMALVWADGPRFLLAAAAIAFVAGIWAADRYAKGVGEPDPSEVVIDEVAALWFVLAVVQPTFLGWLAGFAFFRFFDVVKPWPVSLADRKLKGGFGIMADDILAALYTVALILVCRHFTGLV